MTSIKDLMECMLHELGAFFSKTNYATVEKFSTYDNVFFHEYRISKTECFTIGFHQRTPDAEMHVFLSDACIEAIEKNSNELQQGNKEVKAVNPIVFTIDTSRDKHPHRIHSDRGHYLDGSRLQGNFMKAFCIVQHEICKAFPKTRTAVKKTPHGQVA